jgi:hypothetical protein
LLAIFATKRMLINRISDVTESAATPEIFHSNVHMLAAKMDTTERRNCSLMKTLMLENQLEVEFLFKQT